MGFLPPTAGRSLVGGTSACSSPLRRVAAILSGLRAGDCGLPLLRIGHAQVWVVAGPPLLRERRAAAPLVPLMSGASAGIFFPVDPGSSRLSLVWWIRRAGASLLLPRPLGAGPDGGLLLGPVAPFLEETIEVPMRVRSSSSLSGLRTVGLFPVFPRVFAPELSWLPLTGFDFAGLVAWLILAPRSRNPHGQSGPFSRFITFWRLCEASWSLPLFPRSLRPSLASCLAALPLPHCRWSRDHGWSSAGLI